MKSTLMTSLALCGIALAGCGTTSPDVASNQPAEKTAWTKVAMMGNSASKTGSRIPGPSAQPVKSTSGDAYREGLNEAHPFEVK